MIIKGLPESKGYDMLDEFGQMVPFFVEKGHILNRQLLEKKGRAYKMWRADKREMEA
jgi:hypothetical protein